MKGEDKGGGGRVKRASSLSGEGKGRPTREEDDMGGITRGEMDRKGKGG